MVKFIRDVIALYKRLRIEIDRQDLFFHNFYYEVKDSNVIAPKVLSLEETLNRILTNRVSLCRFGDGEFDMCVGSKMSFQGYNEVLSARLKTILGNPTQKCMVCLPDVFSSLAQYTEDEQWFWRIVMNRRRDQIMKFMNLNVEYGNAFVSRCYLRYRNRSVGAKIFDLWKRLFEGRDLLVVEGRYSRLGVGNDLFAGASSVRRIWCPAEDAFSKYDQIYKTICEYATKEMMILLALGATATVLSYDLSKKGYWAVDVGHLDIEYIWMKMGVDHKCAIPGRYMVECSMGRETKAIPGEALTNHVVADVS